MRRLPVVCVLILLFAGCSPGDDYADPLPLMTPTWRPTPTADKSGKLPTIGTPLAVRIGEPRRPLLPSDFTFAPHDTPSSVSGQILDHLMRATQEIAGYPAKTTVRCVGGRVRIIAGATTNCTVFYQGKAVRWTVTIGTRKPTNDLIDYNVEPHQGVLLREAVYAAWYNSHPDEPELRCDDIPAIQVVTLYTKTSYHCQYLRPPDDRAEEPNPPRWEDSNAIQLTQGGVTFTD